MRQTFFSDIALGGCRSGGGEAPESVYKNEGFNKAHFSSFVDILNFMDILWGFAPGASN
jgi:hypothetical protein